MIPAGMKQKKKPPPQPVTASKHLIFRKMFWKIDSKNDKQRIPC